MQQSQVQLSLDFDNVPAPTPITDQLPDEHRTAALVMLAGLIAKAASPAVAPTDEVVGHE